MTAPTIPAIPAATDGDWSLVAAARAGDRDAFAELYRIHSGRIGGLIAQTVWDWATVEDLVSDVFVRALVNVDQLTFEGRSYGGWLSTVARNVVLDYFKSARVRYATGGDPDPILASQQAPEHQDTRDVEARLRGYVSQLTERQRRSIELRYDDGLDHDAMAEAMGGTVGSSRTRLHKALGNLRKAITSDGYTGSAAFVADIPSPR